MQLAKVALDDKYTLESGRIYVSGSQALVRLPMLQRVRDRAAGLNTAGFISGYRGSPLGGYDLALWQAERYLREHQIVFQPGVNEDLAATAIWGTQQVGLGGRSNYDGVFAIWYGKGPGVDRSGDVFKHANEAGTAPYGGVLVLFGDDPTAKSSTVAFQSEPALIAAGIPVLNPANIQEYLDLGLVAFAMSRYAGVWVGMKCITDTVDGSASVIVDPWRVQLVTPTDFELPPDGVHIRVPDTALAKEQRLWRVRLPAVQAFARANRLDRITHDLPVARRRLGVVASGKSWSDLLHVLQQLGVDEEMRQALGLSIYKVAMPWPLEPEGIRGFAQGQEELLVIEEKRGLIEEQIARILYPLPDRPRLLGKQDEHGKSLLPVDGELSLDQIAATLAARLLRLNPPPRLATRLRAALRPEPATVASPATPRTPWFCAGCPHNTSTRVPEGSRAFAGIGWHTMALFMPNRRTESFTHMGGEGAQWIGQAPFSKDRHVFQNLGDGTYYHSGLLAIRAAVAAKVNITYKILYNDAVAMTGGQPVEGQLTPWSIAQQVAAEGVRRIVVVTDEPNKYPPGTPWPQGVTIRHRRELDAVQRELREIEGVTVLIYDQTCAAEKRRRRKRGRYPDPAKRVFINDLVCEGCGDCGLASNCVAGKPLETEFGRKRIIDQSSCNKDYSCLEGFCPSFVTVHGGGVRKPQRGAAEFPRVELPEPALPALSRPYNILIAGIGGTGVITLGAWLGMAAHLERKGVSVLDQTGLAQKNGAVSSHVRLAAHPDALHGARIGRGDTDLVIGCDMVVAAGAEALATYATGRTRAVINSHVVPLAAFALDPDLPLHDRQLGNVLDQTLGKEYVHYTAAGRLATALLGDAIYTNPFLLGYAWQLGLIPLSRQAIERAIELNGTAVEENLQAFRWGRLAAHVPEQVAAAAAPFLTGQQASVQDFGLEELIAHRVKHLTAYQNPRYAERYLRLVRRVQAAESRVAPGEQGLTRAVAVSYSKLLAYKDEYEVARLYLEPSFRQQLEAQFEGNYRLTVHLAPPLLARRDRQTGRPRKREYGPWIFKAFRLLAGLRFLRGTPFDPFGHTAERKLERQLIRDYEALVEELIAELTVDNHATAVALAELPQQIRGFGHVKLHNLQRVRQQQQALLVRFRSGQPPQQEPAAAVARVVGQV
ncbi:MAG: indolepyruvate ferredoxin oxidoreductase family protein [Xanthomonadaceae bacterium]|nr:indolepyruvate ferredoxin oxidoreductase family protein [Xanthomonadaceae bacterium]